MDRLHNTHFIKTALHEQFWADWLFYLIQKVYSQTFDDDKNDRRRQLQK